MKKRETEKSRFRLSKVRSDRAEIVQAYADSRKPRANYQDALDEIIETGLKVKRLLPTEEVETA